MPDMCIVSTTWFLTGVMADITPRSQQAAPHRSLDTSSKKLAHTPSSKCPFPRYRGTALRLQYISKSWVFIQTETLDIKIVEIQFLKKLLESIKKKLPSISLIRFSRGQL
jgi:hypothetical protein